MATDYRQGDYRVVADRLRPAAEQLVALAAPAAGSLVLDVAAGTGNVARLCAARGASVLAVDRVLEQLQLGRSDPDADIAWIAGDAHALPVQDHVADAALSTFGLIYADDPERAVRELARVCRSGGTIGLTAWPDDGFQTGFTGLLAEANGQPGGHDHLATWGTAERLTARLSVVADDLRVGQHQLVTRAASLDAWWSAREKAPPVASARARLDDAGYAELGRRMRALAWELGEQSEDGFAIPESYLVAVARVR